MSGFVRGPVSHAPPACLAPTPAGWPPDPMAVRTVLVCETQVPLVRGGAELLVRQLVDELRQRGFEADRVSVPFKWYPKDELLPHAAAWGLLDLSESNGRPIDLVIATKFPTYLARHPRKVCWLVHQHRAAYELAATPYSDFGARRDRRRAARPPDGHRRAGARRVRRALHHLAHGQRAAAQRYNGLDSTPLYHPPLLAQPDHAGRLRQLRALGGQARTEQARRSRRALGGLLARAAVAGRGRRGQPARARRARGRRGRRGAPRVVPRRGRATTSCRPSTSTPWPCSTCPSTKTTAWSRSKASWRPSRS